MYCKKCKYNSYDHVPSCPKCGMDWNETRKLFFLNWINTSGYQWLAPGTGGDGAQPAMPELVVPSPSAIETEDLFPQVSKEPAMAADISPGPSAQTADGDIFVDFSQDTASPAMAEPVAPVTPIAEIESAHLPDLDFSSAPAKEEELFAGNIVDEMTEEDVVELDFSTSFDDLETQQTAQSGQAKHDDLFIPELEEMLAPLTEGAGASDVADKEQQFFGEGDILLDFGTSDTEGSDSDLYDIDLDFSEKKS